LKTLGNRARAKIKNVDVWKIVFNAAALNQGQQHVSSLHLLLGTVKSSMRDVSARMQMASSKCLTNDTGALYTMHSNVTAQCKMASRKMWPMVLVQLYKRRKKSTH